MGATMGKNGGNLLDSLPSTQGTLHVVMLGLDSAGKTTALYRLKFDQYLNTVPTIGFNCEKVRGSVGKAKGVNFLVWDVGGQEKLRPLWRSYTRCTDGIVFVVDSVDVERMEEAKMELMRTAKCPDNHGVPVLILANKQDLPGAREPRELEKLLGLHELTPAVQSAGTIQKLSPPISNSGCEQTTIPPRRIVTVSAPIAEVIGSSASSTISSASSTVTIKSASSGSQSSASAASSASGSQSVHQGGQSNSVITHTSTVDGATTASTPITRTPLLHNQQTTVVGANCYCSAPPRQSTQYQSNNSGTGAHHHKHSNFRTWHIQPACAITGEGLQEGLEALYDMIIKKRKINKANRKKR